MGKRLNERGITLIELLVALALISIVAGGLTGVYWGGNKAFERQTAASDAQYMARSSMQQIINDIREGIEVALVNDDLVIIKDSDTITYHYDDSDREILRNTSPISENITGTQFNIGSGSLVEINIEATVNGWQYTLNGTASPRIIRVADQGAAPGDFMATDGAGNIFYSDDGVEWVQMPETPEGVNDVAWNDEVLVAVGDDGQIYSFIEGTWQVQDSGISENLNSVIFGGDGKFVAVGDDKTIVYSTNGSDWYEGSLPPGGGATQHIDCVDVFWGDGTYITACTDKKYLLSGDGTVWEWDQINATGNPDFSAVTYGEGTFVMVGQSGRIFTSPDADNWTQRDSGVNSNLRDVVWGGDLFVVVGDEGVILFSDNGGITWSDSIQVTLDPEVNDISDINIIGIEYAGQMFIAIGEENTLGSSILSSNGINWEVHAIDPHLENI